MTRGDSFRSNPLNNEKNSDERFSSAVQFCAPTIPSIVSFRVSKCLGSDSR